jgi:hypothetical protein
MTRVIMAPLVCPADLATGNVVELPGMLAAFIVSFDGAMLKVPLAALTPAAQTLRSGRAPI